MIREPEGPDALAGPALKDLDSSEGAHSEEPELGHCIHGFGRLERETVANAVFLILEKDRLTEPQMLGDV